MSFALEPFTAEHLAPASKLMGAAAFATSGLTAEEWARVLTWLYLSPSIQDPNPRAFVLTRDRAVLGHIGLTKSSFSDGARRFEISQTVNWYVDPSHNAGLWSVKLLQEALAGGDPGIILGGVESIHKLLPRVGFDRRRDVGRYIKVLRPWKYLLSGRTGRLVARNAAKLALATTAHFSRHPGPDAATGFVVRTHFPGNGDCAGQLPKLSWPSHDGGPYRNTLEPRFLAWAQEFPLGEVVVRDLVDGETVIGRLALVVRLNGEERYVTVLGIDSTTANAAVWRRLVEEAVAFACEFEATHVNALGSLPAVQAALTQTGFKRLSGVPFWVLDRDHALDAARDWHVTAIEGDIGFLFA